jgi:hypothetical protein
MVNIRNKEICDKAAAAAVEYAKDYGVVIHSWGCNFEGVLTWITYSENSENKERKHLSLIPKPSCFFWSDTPLAGGFSILLRDPFGADHFALLDGNFYPRI